MNSQKTPVYSASEKIAMASSILVPLAWTAGQFAGNRPGYAEGFAPNWIALAATGLTIGGIIRFKDSDQWLRIQIALRWFGLLLMIWTANGLPFDLLRISGLIPMEIDWPGMVTRTLALTAAIMLARIVLKIPDKPVSMRPATWYGYAAFLLALPYPVLRTFWAFGASPGLDKPGAGGVGFIPWLACIPWLLAAAMSLLLASKRQMMSRRLLLTAGWTATTIVAMIGPAACWTLIRSHTGAVENPLDDLGIAGWVFALFYISWFLWAIAAAAATRSFQLRTAVYKGSPVAAAPSGVA